MARVLKRHKSTIFREIKRNFWADDAFPKKYAGYFGMAAHQRTQQRRSKQRKQRRTFYQPRLRRECFGELIQIDGSDHRWFEDRAPPCTLLVFIDDATSTLM